VTEAIQKWHYRLVVIQFDIEQVNKTLDQWAQAGWELVSGTASTAAVGVIAGTIYAMYWRKAA
jgi:hypothetical protein